MAHFKGVIADKMIADIYKKFPRKMGKTQGMRTVRTQCKTKESIEQLSLAVDNYLAHITTEGTEKQYILYFSTFMNQWRDWLDPETGSVVKPEISLSGLGFEE